ncbi:MAG: preprotein translocase subunit SecG [Bacteroidetes bacterium]|jgi:preprotein translocase subunit SecG|nr:preprotein translocase subunit SecG [Bacteroidota bacterium]
MTILFVILIVLASVFLGFIILVQNPKGGGLAANVGGFSNQFMGVKQTTDVLEKGTWTLSIIVALLCIFSAFFMQKSSSTQVRDTKVNATQSAPAQQQQAPMPLPQPGK